MIVSDIWVNGSKKRPNAQNDNFFLFKVRLLYIFSIESSQKFLSAGMQTELLQFPSMRG